MMEQARPLKEWREERGLSLRELAGQSGIHFTTISEIEQGHRKPHARTAAQLGRALGVGQFQIKEFFGRTREAIPNDEALLLASPAPPPEGAGESETQELVGREAQGLHKDMLKLMQNLATYLVKAGRGKDVERVLRRVLRRRGGGRR